MNVNTADKIRGRLVSNGWTECTDGENPDAVIFNTCCVRNTAEQKILSHIAVAGRQKQANKKMLIAVIGCMGEKDRNKLQKTRPYIDIVLGTDNPESIADIICERFAPLVPSIPAAHPKSHTKPKNKTDIVYIDITYGCENYCSYCIVPFVRGKLRCRPAADITAEFMTVKDTAKTIFLLGQNVNEYFDPEAKTDFADLLSALCKIPGSFKINFLSSHPKDFDEKIIRVIAENEQIQRDIHLPLQSGCDKILRLMNRKYTVAEYEQKVARLRECVPGVHITTDIICGFPTETEDDFAATVETVKRIAFNAAYIFPYSRRSGTGADGMDGQVPHAVKKARTTELIAAVREMSLQRKRK